MAALPEATEAGEVVDEVVREVAARITEELARRQQTCRRLALTVETESGSRMRQRTLTHATAQGAEVLLAARYLLGKAEVCAGVTALRLRASELSRRTEVQLSLLDAREEGAGAAGAPGNGGGAHSPRVRRGGGTVGRGVRAAAAGAGAGVVAGAEMKEKSIGIEWDGRGRPVRLQHRGGRIQVVAVVEEWEEAGCWWQGEEPRRVYRVLTAGGQVCEVHGQGGEWRVVRVLD